MILIWIPILFFLVIVAMVWIYGFIVQNDLSVPTRNIKSYKKILAIYAHPDDELLSCGGTIGKQANATVYFLTKGERGTPDAQLDLKLKDIRHNEAKEVTKILGAKKLIHDDFGDGQLDQKKKALNNRIRQIISEQKPDLVITHELTGGYGHPDHMTCSEVVTDLVTKDFPKIHLWHNSSPDSVRKMANLPVQMAKDKSFKNKEVSPTHKVFIGLKNFNRIRGLYKYVSQYQSFRSAFPFKPIPMGFIISMSFFEFFHEVI